MIHSAEFFGWSGDESIAVLSADGWESGANRAGHGRAARRAVRLDARRGKRSSAARRRAGLRFDLLYGTSLSRRGIRVVEQSGDAGPLYRDADQTHPRGAAWSGVARE